MSRISSAKYVATLHLPGSSAASNTKYINCQESDKGANVIRVPSQNWKVYRSVWNNNDLRRIKTASQVETKEEVGRNTQEYEADRKHLQWESEQRKRFLQEIDIVRRAKLAKSQDENSGAEKLLDKVFLAKHENTEEVKRANRIILAAKCHVVRDAQMNEKQERCREQREEEMLIGEKMVRECEKALAIENRRQQKMRVLNQRYANELRQQLRVRDSKKFQEAKRIEEEAKTICEVKIAIMNDHLAKQRAKQEKIVCIRNELKKSNEMRNFFKNVAYEEQRTAEMKAQEYMRMKREREIQLERDRRLERERKQRETDRLLTLQMKFLQMKNEQESMTMRRIQEQKEREFRQKEREAAIERKRNQEHMFRVRETQLFEMQKFRMLQSATEKEEHDRAISELDMAKKQEIENRKKMIELKEKYRSEIIAQIAEKGITKKDNQTRLRNENTADQEREKQHQKNIKSIIAAKVNAMRASQIPETIVQGVERKLNLKNN